MSPSMGVVEVIFATAVAANRPAMDSPTPTTAVSSGIPAATKEPSVTTSTTRATSSPTASMSERAGKEIENSSPPRATCEPAGRAAPSSSETARMVSFTSAGVVEDWPSSCTWTSAARPSSDSAVAEAMVPSISNGVETATTESMSSSCPTAVSTPATIAGSDASRPSGATTTMRAEVPETWGKVAERRSRASWDSVPGMRTELSKPVPKASAAPPAAASMSTQATTTVQPRRAHQRPSE